MAPTPPQRHGSQNPNTGPRQRSDVFSPAPTSIISRRQNLLLSPSSSPSSFRRNSFFSPKSTPRTGLRTPLCRQRVQYKLWKERGSESSPGSGHSSSNTPATPPDSGRSPRLVEPRVSRRVGQNRLKCTECGDGFIEVGSLLRHFQAAHMKPEYPCPFPSCRWTYVSWLAYVDHCAVDHVKRSRAYECEYPGCGREFRSWLHFLEHLKDHQYHESRRSASPVSNFGEKEIDEYEEHKRRSSRCSFTPEDRAGFTVPANTPNEAPSSLPVADLVIKEEIEDLITTYAFLHEIQVLRASSVTSTPNKLDIAIKYQDQYPAYKKLHEDIVEIMKNGGVLDYEKYYWLIDLQQKMHTMRLIVCQKAGREGVILKF